MSMTHGVIIGTVVLAIFAVVAVAGVEDVKAQVGGAYLDTLTYLKQDNKSIAIENLLANNIDIYYLTITGEQIKTVTDAGHDIYDHSSGAIYSLYANPTDDYTTGFNPFSQQKARFALNYMIDRDSVVHDILGSGSPMISAIPPHSFDYISIHRNLESFGFTYDLAKANMLFEEALEPIGAVKSADNKWYYDNQPIEITIFIREDDANRKQIGQLLADDLESIGFTVNRQYGDLLLAYQTVYASDPADQQWHLYTEAFGNYGYGRYDDSLLGTFYAPWYNNVPGGEEETFWQYQNEDIDRLTIELYTESYTTLEERAEIVVKATTLGVTESVRVFIATERTSYPVRSEVTGVVNLPASGILNRYTPLNVQLSDDDTNLNIGVRHISQGSWNPIGGLRDSYGLEIWSLLRDTSYIRDPYTRELVNARNELISVQTNGPDGKLGVPSSAIIWNSETNMWTSPEVTEATSKIRYDLKLANWHNGQPMDINDILYLFVFDPESMTMMSETDLATDQYTDLDVSRDIVAIDVIDDDTIDVYLDYWSQDEADIVTRASLWPTVPWEIYIAMNEVVRNGDADWYAEVAQANSGNWFDMLDSADVELALVHLRAFKDANNEMHVPVFLYQNATFDYVSERYNASISWIEDKNHLVISNGPFYLSGEIGRDSTDSITSMIVKKFDDSTYPFGVGYWSEIIDAKSLSGSVTIGALTSITGNAFKYGQDMQAGFELAESHFNEYLTVRDENWSLNIRYLDTGTNPSTVLSHLMALNNEGIKIVAGPSIDLITPDVINYANDNDMVLLSCCSSVPSLSIEDDALFRLLPDQHKHGQAIVDVMRHQSAGISHIIPVGIQAAWSVELLDATKTAFERDGGTSDDIIYYEYLFDDHGMVSNDTNARTVYMQAAQELATAVQDAIEEHGVHNVAVFYTGFGESPEFLSAASEYDVLDDIRWFGADQNTADPNISENPTSTAFANRVQFTVLQPTVHENVINQEIVAHLMQNGIDPSPYVHYAYDTIWLLGLSLLSAQTDDSTNVENVIIDTSAQYVGAIGSTELNSNGDLKDTPYQAWMMSDADWVPYNNDDFSMSMYMPKICR